MHNNNALFLQTCPAKKEWNKKFPEKFNHVFYINIEKEVEKPYWVKFHKFL